MLPVQNGKHGDMLKEKFSNKNILLTGATGFKGSWLATWLTHLGSNVYGFSSGLPSGPCLFNLLNLSDKINSISGNINRIEELDAAFDQVQPDFVFHLAAQAIVKRSYSDPVDTFQTNVMGTVNVLDALRRYEGSCVGVMVTSDKCYHNNELGRPFIESDGFGGNDLYSASKGAAEVVIRSYFHSFFSNRTDKQVVAARAGNVIGGGDWADNRIVPDCIRSWVDEQVVELRSPNAIRPWQHVLEPLSGYLMIAAMATENEKISGEGFNFGPNVKDRYTVLDLVKTMSSLWSDDESIYKVSDEANFEEAMTLLLDSSKAKQWLNWQPVLDFHQTVEYTTSWYKNYYINRKDVYEYTIQQIDQYQSLMMSVQ